MKTILYNLTFILLIGLCVLSCGQGADKTGHQKIAMVLDVGGVNDQSFNQSAWEGLKALAKGDSSVKVNYFESKTQADYMPYLQNAIDDNAGLIWGVGDNLGPAVQEISALHQERKFAIIDFNFDPPLPNVTAIVFRVEEAAYLAGYLAARLTKTKKVGFIGGFETPVIDGFEYGFRAGAHTADPTVRVFTQYTASYSDSDKGKSIAKAMAKEGIDILFPVTGDAGNGAIELAREQDLYIIGVDRDQSYLAPKNIITSVLKRVDKATESISKEFLNGNFSTGTRVLGLIDHAVGLTPVNPDIVTDKALLGEITGLEHKIVSGEIKVPGTKSEFLAAGYPLNK